MLIDDEGLDASERPSSPFSPPSSSSRHPSRTHPRHPSRRRNPQLMDFSKAFPSPTNSTPTTTSGHHQERKVDIPTGQTREKKSGPSCKPSSSSTSVGTGDSDVVVVGRGPCPPQSSPLHRIILPGANSQHLPANQEIKITKRQGERNEPLARLSSAPDPSGQTFPLVPPPRTCRDRVKMADEMRCKRASLTLAQQQPKPLLLECGSVVRSCRLAVQQQRVSRVTHGICRYGVAPCDHPSGVGRAARWNGLVRCADWCARCGGMTGGLS